MDAATLAALVTEPFTAVGPLPITPALAVTAAVAVLLCILLVNARRALGQERRYSRSREEEHAGRLDAVLHAQAEITGRMRSMAETFGGRQAELTRTLSERLDGLSIRVGRSIQENGATTASSLAALGERLAVIDRAQSEIRDLAGNVVKLQDILANKQSRGAFGEGRMRAIVTDSLPSSAFSFQPVLSNGKRPDCLIVMPNGAPSLAIDAKFPLESWTAFRDAIDADERRGAAQRLRRDMDVHVRAIADKYLIPGETQDTAFLFVPSEAIFAELHETFDDIVQKAYRARVVIVSPALLVLSIQVIQSIVKDARMRVEAGRIQREVALLSEEFVRLEARVGALKNHFGQATRDVEQILTSTGKLIRRGERIASVELGEEITALGYSDGSN